jgi:hypothetical protein
MTINSMSYNAIAADGSTSAGFRIAFSSSDTAPATFVVRHRLCLTGRPNHSLTRLKRE